MTCCGQIVATSEFAQTVMREICSGLTGPGALIAEGRIMSARGLTMSCKRYVIAPGLRIEMGHKREARASERAVPDSLAFSILFFNCRIRYHVVEEYLHPVK